MVVFAMATARRTGNLIPASVRIPSYAVWEVAVFVLNVLAFILVGFQLKGILERIDGPTVSEYAFVGAVVCLATILARIAWVTMAAAVSRWRYGTTGCSGEGIALSPKAAALVGWCGMRGIVTLAAALALPAGSEGTAPFPHRDLILCVSFCVVLGTLVVQGLTLRPLMNALKLEDDGSVEREVRHAHVEILRAALGATANLPAEEMSALIRRRYEVMLGRAQAELAAAEPGHAPSEEHNEAALVVDSTVVRTALSAERQRLVALRADGTIGDAAFQRLEQRLDLEELHLEQIVPVVRNLQPE
jgi:CPA1 family monovalent cation:H+ antiporter